MSDFKNNVWMMEGDCLGLMDGIPDGSVDMVLCDLPYGVTHNAKDIALPFDKLWCQYNRVVKEDGAILLFGQGLFYADLVVSNRRNFRYDIVWDKMLKTGFLNAKRMPLRRHEQIAVFYRRMPVYNPQFGVGKPSHSTGRKEPGSEQTNRNYGNFKFLGNGENQVLTRKYPSSIMTFQKPHPSVCNHPTEKPADLLEYLVRTYTNEGDTVLDNCMGSGSTGVACVRSGRRFIGIELDHGHFTTAESRVNSEIFKSQQILY